MSLLSNLMSKNFVTQLVGTSWGFYQRDLELKSPSSNNRVIKKKIPKKSLTWVFTSDDMFLLCEGNKL